MRRTHGEILWRVRWQDGVPSIEHGRVLVHRGPKRQVSRLVLADGSVARPMKTPFGGERWHPTAMGAIDNAFHLICRWAGWWRADPESLNDRLRIARETLPRLLRLRRKWHDHGLR